MTIKKSLHILDICLFSKKNNRQDDIFTKNSIVLNNNLVVQFACATMVHICCGTIEKRFFHKEYSDTCL